LTSTNHAILTLVEVVSAVVASFVAAASTVAASSAVVVGSSTVVASAVVVSVVASSVIAVGFLDFLVLVHHLVFAIATSRPFTVVAWLAFALGRTCFVQPCMEDDECRTEC